MSDSLPIACTLNPKDFRAREVLMAELGRDALVGARQDGSRAVLRFAAGAGVRDRVASFVDGESACCAFLHMEVAEAGDEVVLRIDAPAEAELTLTEMLDAFRA